MSAFQWVRVAARPRLVALAALAVLVPAVLVASAPPDGPGDGRVAAAPVEELPGTADALGAAREQGSPVRIGELTSETRVVYAQPDGTMLAELTAAPVRAVRDGEWVDLDTGLEHRADGTIAPKAAVTEVAFSGGGEEAPLVRLGADGAGIALWWPEPLPVPTVAGDTATYPEVLPGVDLALRATVDGYAQYLVIEDAVAAANPELERIAFDVETDGLDLAVGEDGGLTATDADGAIVFQADRSFMWDSRRTGDDPLTDPGPGTGHATAGVTLVDATLVIAPDLDLLTGADTVYPVVIDPKWQTANRFAWGKVMSGKPNNSFWNGGTDGAEVKVGYCGWAGCSGVGAVRSYFKFDTRFLAGKTVLAANLNTSLAYAPSCNDVRSHGLYFLHGAGHQVWTTTTWNSLGSTPATHVGTRRVSGPYAGCPEQEPLGISVRNHIKTNDYSSYYYRAVGTGAEADKYTWRNYDLAATKLIVQYNTAPAKPTSLTTDPSLPAPCTWCAGEHYLSSSSIRLRAAIADAEGDQVKAVWRVYGKTTGTEEAVGPSQSAGTVHSRQVNLSGQHGRNITWAVWGNDGATGGPYSNGPHNFIVDLEPPGEAPVVDAALYPADNRWHGGVGVPGTFTFEANGVGDVDHYKYGWSDPPATKVAADALGGDATVTLAPSVDGPQALYVQSVDRAGNPSDVTVHHFYVRPGNGSVAYWPLDGDAADEAYLGDRDGQLNGDVAYVPGAVGTGIELDGSGDHVSAPHTVDTRNSFTVSAWVRLDTDRGARTVLSQDGEPLDGKGYAGFHLWYRPDNGGQWVFGMVNDSVTDTPMARSSEPAQTGVWTHLTGVYNASTGKLELYVNGVLSGTADHSGQPWNATGRVQIGRGLWNGAHVDHWDGRIDEVSIYDRALTEAEIRGSVSNANVQVGHWRFDEGGGTTAVNAVPGGDMAVLSEGAWFTEEGHSARDDEGAVAFDGSKGSVATEGPAVRTDQSFTVAAWVKLDDAGPARAVASQDGVNFAGFDLWYRPVEGEAVGKWAFGMAHSDETYRGTDLAWSDGPAQIGEWVHLTGVYDAAAGELRLYVDGVLAGTAERTVEPWNAAGPFRIGSTMWNGNPAVDWWQGSIDEVQVYSRALSDAELEGIVSHSEVWLGNWPLDGNASDVSGELIGTIGGDADWTAGQTSMPDATDLAVRFDGDGDFVQLPAVLDPTESFSVSAWARLDAVGERPVVISQDGGRTSAFQLHVTDEDTWAFAMADGDDADAPRDRAVGSQAQVGVWTHLVGVYDAAGDRLLLYVNGVLSGTAEHTESSPGFSAKALIIGAGHCSSQGCDRPNDFAGAVDDVVVHGRALFAAEIRELAGRDLTLVHNWRLDETGGASAADAVGDRTGTLENGAAWDAGRAGNALHFDGVDDSMSTTGVDLRTDESFTVAAWVHLSQSECDFASYSVCRLDAVSLDGADTSRFRLGHVTDLDQNLLGAWTFEMAESDDPDQPVMKATVSALPSQFDTWVHLVGVYNEATGAMRLYVDGELNATTTTGGGWHGEGGLQLGRGLEGGADTHFWPGKVDDVRLYTGVLTGDRVTALHSSYPAEASAPQLPEEYAAHWAFDEGAGAVAADASGNGHDLAMPAGGEWSGGRNGSAARFDGGGAEAPGPVLDTGGDFSAAAWVYLTESGDANATVLAQDGDRVSSFLLQFDAAAQRWAVRVPRTDTDDPEATVLSSSSPAVIGRWTHLALTYDAELRQLRLYVNGLASGTAVGVTAQDAAGATTVGRALWNGEAVDFFPGSIDDVRLFEATLDGGQVRAVHDDVPPAVHGDYRFENDTARDFSWRGNDAATTGGVSFTDGVSGRAMVLDGETGGATTEFLGMYTHDSLTVSAWAKLDSDDRIATVVGQDGVRMSGYALQYRPGLDRWVFGSTEQDADASPPVYAASQQAAEIGEWVHLAGVYDYPARQLRLYVDGELAGTADDVALWRADGPLTLGYGKDSGEPAHHFPGAIDEVRVDLGAVGVDVISDRASRPEAPDGQVGRYVDSAGNRRTGLTGDPALDGYHFERALGTAVPEGPGTRMLYSCLYNGKPFTSPYADCEGHERIGEVGLVYATPPADVPTATLYRCREAGVGHFDSIDPACEGFTVDGPLGHLPAYASFDRYRLPGYDHWSTTHGVHPGYVWEGTHGYLSLLPQEGTRTLYACVDAERVDHYPSLEADCEGGIAAGTLGELWTDPPTDADSRAIHRCLHNGQYFVSTDEDCEGLRYDRLLGYVLAEVPGGTPEPE